MRPDDEFDFTRRELEANEEMKAAAWAENNGWITRKLKWEGRRDAPDRLFAGHGCLFLAEFKKPSRKTAKLGGKSGGQSEESKRFAAAGIEIPVFYTSDSAIAFLRRKMLNSLLS